MKSECSATDADGSSPMNSSSRSALFLWLAASMAATAVISIGPANAPPRVRLIGLLPVAYGLSIGWIIVWMKRQLEVRPSQRMVIIAAMFIAPIGWIGVTWESYRLDKAMSVAAPKDQLAAQLIKEFEKQSGMTTGTSLEGLERPSFSRYLAKRVKQLGEWSSPWPECFWVAEILAVAAMASYVAGRLMQPEKTEAAS